MAQTSVKAVKSILVWGIFELEPTKLSVGLDVRGKEDSRII